MNRYEIQSERPASNDLRQKHAFRFRGATLVFEKYRFADRARRRPSTSKVNISFESDDNFKEACISPEIGENRNEIAFRHDGSAPSAPEGTRPTRK